MTRDGKRVYSTAVFHEHNLITSELVIRGFQPRDVAIYKCIFYNEKNVTAEANTSLGIHKSYSCSSNRKRKLLREFGYVLFKSLAQFSVQFSLVNDHRDRHAQIVALS